MCGNWNIRQAMLQEVLRATTFCISTCFQSFSTPGFHQAIGTAVLARIVASMVPIFVVEFEPQVNYRCRAQLLVLIPSPDCEQVQRVKATYVFVQQMLEPINHHQLGNPFRGTLFMPGNPGHFPSPNSRE